MIDNRFYRFVVLFVALCYVSIAGAQSGISVKSFMELSQDLDARVNFPVTDQNGQKCALVKVVTTESNFSFDNGQLGVTKVIHKPELSEWWVYLPAKTMKIKVMHPQLGQLKDSDDGYYYFPSPLKESTCYRMELTTAKVTIVVEEERKKAGFLIINSQPEGADVYLTEDGVENYAGTTPFQKKLTYATYNYRLKKPLYHDEVGVVAVDNTKVEQNILLLPAFGSLRVTSTPLGAKVTLQNDSRTYTTPCSIEQIPSGTYRVNVVAPRYASFFKDVVIEDGKQSTLDAVLDARFANVTINTLPGASININGQIKGRGNYSEELGEGIYDIEVSLDKHRSASRQIEVVAKQPQTITLEPSPIYGSLDVITSPMYANVTINGKSYGDTPLSIENMLIGDYEVVLSKPGCASVTKRVTITEKNQSTIEVALQNSRAISIIKQFDVPQDLLLSGSSYYKEFNTQINANYNDVVVLLDGIPVGTTPLSLESISLGNHIVSVANTFGVTMRDTLINFSKNNVINLALYDQQKDSVLIEDCGIGWDDVIFGVNIIEESGKKGLINYLGELIVSCDFDDVNPYIENGYYWVKKDNKRGLYEPGKGLIGLWEYNPQVIFYDSCDYNHKYKCIKILQDGLWGVVSTATGEIIVPAKYEKVSLHDDAIRVTYKKPGYKAATGVFLYDGTQTIKPRYDCLNEFANGRALFRKFDKTIGFTDIYGNETIIPANYTIGSWGMGGATFASGVFRVKDKVSGKWGYMNSQLELVIPCIYDAISEYDDAPNFNNGIVALKLNEDKLVLDSKGNIIVSCKKNGYNDIEIVELSDFTWNKGRFFRYDGYSINNNTLIKIENKDGLCGLMNVKGHVVVPCKYKEEDINWYNDNNDNYFVLTDGDESVVMNEYQKELLVLPSNVYVADIKDGFIEVREMDSGSYGYFNTKGDKLTNLIYGYGSKSVEQLSQEGDLSLHSNDIALILESFRISEELAILNIGDKFGFIDNKGNIKVPLIYTAVTPFEDGISYVRLENGSWKKIYKNSL